MWFNKFLKHKNLQLWIHAWYTTMCYNWQIDGKNNYFKNMEIKRGEGEKEGEGVAIRMKVGINIQGRLR